MVLTNYKPKGHDLDEYVGLAASQESKLVTIFPRDTKEQERRFELLQKAYVNARYNKNYKITKEDLEWLAERVKKLQVLTEEVCRKWIVSLKATSVNKTELLNNDIIQCKHNFVMKDKRGTNIAWWDGKAVA